MGQRLVITVQDNSINANEIAKIYYHWSGYTLSAFEEIKTLWGDIADTVNKDKRDYDSIIKAIIMSLQSRGGGVDCADFEYVKERFPDLKLDEERDRNFGLIAITKTSMENIQRWSEGDSIINLDDGTACNDIYSIYDIDEYLEEFGNEFQNEDGTISFSEDELIAPKGAFLSEYNIMEDTDYLYDFYNDNPVSKLDNDQIVVVFG